MKKKIIYCKTYASNWSVLNWNSLLIKFLIKLKLINEINLKFQNWLDWKLERNLRKSNAICARNSFFREKDIVKKLFANDVNACFGVYTLLLVLLLSCKFMHSKWCKCTHKTNIKLSVKPFRIHPFWNFVSNYFRNNTNYSSKPNLINCFKLIWSLVLKNILSYKIELIILYVCNSFALLHIISISWSVFTLIF